ncbi:hypothetical protein KF946_12165 [Idiomarina loihiensis]|uniref:hypothetical protein n=1 Tax=Idiomarina loihiensis TaxID=135577 RepID=UPI00129CD143|nr:hypothetical protein [Idiomarina loihiensis]MRJ45811.1 hypothetical protein [Idiomarina loihiensis]UTW32749.1 hypothetical protein KF946_12165 [Idiomarina loihiensis]
MLRKLNFTDRKKIERREAIFSITENGANREFEVLFDLDLKGIPENASLYVEGYHKETRQRYSFGTVATQKPPSNRLLDEIDLSGETLFRVLIIDESGMHGKILASGEGFTAGGSSTGDAKSLLAVEVKDLGHEVWKLEFNHELEPELYLDRKIPDAINRISDDQLFQSLIIPAAFRQILAFYLWESEDLESEIRDEWMKFAEIFGGKPPHENDDVTEKFMWIDEVISGFSEKYRFCEGLVEVLEKQ